MPDISQTKIPNVQFIVKDELTGKITDKGYTLDIFKFKFEILQNTIPDYISNYNFIWQFGDGEYSTEISPTHWYKAPGDYEITLQLYGIDDNKRYTLFKNGLSKIVHIYNFTPNYEYNSYNDFIYCINEEGLSPETSIYYWDENPVINLTAISFNSWQTYDVDKGINKINLNVTKSNYPLLKIEDYNSNLYLHLAATDKFLDIENQPTNSITLTGNPIYITRDLSGNIMYIDDIPGATFIGTSAIGEFKYSGIPSVDNKKTNTQIEICTNGSSLRTNYDIDNNINNTFEYPIMLTKTYGFGFENTISENISSKLNGFISSSGIDSNNFDIFKYKYIGKPINFIFRYTVKIDDIHYPISFINNLLINHDNTISLNNDTQTLVGKISLNYIKNEDIYEVDSLLYTLKSDIIQQPSQFDSTKGGYLKGELIYNGIDNVENCFIRIELYKNLIDLTDLVDNLIVDSSEFNISQEVNIRLRKINENFSLAEQYHKNNIQPSIKNLPELDNFVDVLFGNTEDPNSFNVRTYERISNYIYNINDIDTCTVDVLYDQYHLVNLYITNLNYIYPPNLRRVIDLFSINISKLRGGFNYYGLDFNKNGYSNQLFGKNIGKKLDISSYNVTAGVNIVAKEKFSNKFSLIDTNIIINQLETENISSSLSTLQQIYPNSNIIDDEFVVYPLSGYKNDITTNSTTQLSNIGWGWNLILPQKFNLSDYYEFYEYIPTQISSLENLNNIIDWGNKYNTITYNELSSVDSWNDIKLRYLTQTLYNNLLISGVDS